MQKGFIVRVMDKGYGFIKAEGMEKDLFFHSNELQNVSFDELKGDGTEEVEFEVADGEKGKQAVKVTRI